MISDSIYINISRINIAHEFVLNQNNICEYPNGRKYYGIIYCIDGEAEYKFASGSRSTMHTGDILLLSPSSAYSISTKKEFKHYTVNFEIFEETSNLDFLSAECYLLQTENHQWYAHNFKKLVDCWKSRKSCFEMQAIACLYELLSFVCIEVLEKENRASSHFRLNPAKEYINQNYSADITLDFLASCVNMSVTNFRREWLKLYGESPLKYRDRIRLSYAQEYLRSGYYTVSEVSEKCGFEDVNYFIRFFKKHIGVTPGKYKKLL